MKIAVDGTTLHIGERLSDLEAKMTGGNGEDKDRKLGEKLDLILKQQEEFREVLDELIEKLSELGVNYGDGFEYDS